MSLPVNFASWCTHSLALFCSPFQPSLIAYLHSFTLATNHQKHPKPGTPVATTHTRLASCRHVLIAFLSDFLSGSNLLFCRPSSNAIHSLSTPPLRVHPISLFIISVAAQPFLRVHFFYFVVHYQPTEICTREPTAITLG